MCNKGLGKRQRKFCSKSCAGKAVGHSSLGKPAWNKGLKGFRAGERRPGIIPKGQESSSWKGELVGYRGLHLWVHNALGSPETCVECGVKGTGHQMHWANVSGEYKRERDDWKRLCPRCHRAFDKSKRDYKLNEMAY